MLDGLEGLDEAVELEDIDLDDTGETKAPKNDKIALIDADTIAFAACLSTEEEIDMLPREFYSDEEWENILNNPTYIEDKGVYYEIDTLQALAKAEDKIQRILDKTGCLTAELWFTGGKGNFRYTVKSDYKANRVGKHTPAGLKEVKELLLERYDGDIATDYEADDIVVYKKVQEPDKYIMCAIDKDVYNSVPGIHFNYYESSHYNKEMKFIEVSNETALLWPYLQTILGDTTDNIQGCKGIGPKIAIKFVNEGMTEQEMWEGVVKAYESKGMTSIDAVITMNLVNMHLLKMVDGELQIVLWHPSQLEGEDNE